MKELEEIFEKEGIFFKELEPFFFYRRIIPSNYQKALGALKANGYDRSYLYLMSDNPEPKRVREELVEYFKPLGVLYVHYSAERNTYYIVCKYPQHYKVRTRGISSLKAKFEAEIILLKGNSDKSHLRTSLGIISEDRELRESNSRRFLALFGGSHGGEDGITFLGGAGEVGRTCYLLNLGGRRIMVDCGVSFKQGNSIPHFSSMGCKPTEIDLVILTHSHSDHCGAVPLLYRMGYRNPIICTEATRDLSALTLLDNLSVGRAKMYSISDIRGVVSLMVQVKINKPVELLEGIVFNFQNAGHVLGSFSFSVSTPAGSYFFSNDIRLSSEGILRGAPFPKGTYDKVFLEATYLKSVREGGSLNSEGLRELLARSPPGSKFLFPVFSVGRSQEVLKWVLDNFPEEPIFVSGSIRETTELTVNHMEGLKGDFRKEVYSRDDAFFFRENVYFSPGEAPPKGCRIFISTGGMCSGGPIREQIKASLFDPKSTLILTGFQAGDTLGRALQRGEMAKALENLSLPPEMESKVCLRVLRAGFFGGHITRREIMKIAGYHSKDDESRVNLVHGENLLPLRKGSVKYLVPKNKDYLEIS